MFVTDDGAETDLDLGHYERFIDVSLSQNSSVTSGKVYWNVLQKERQGDYDGGTVQVIPHITDEIKRRIALDSDKYDVHIVEIGGTVGDIEGLPFLEAIRQFAVQHGRRNSHLPSCDAGPLYRRLPGNEDQAHPAFGQGAAVPGHPAGHHRLPFRSPPVSRPQG